MKNYILKYRKPIICSDNWQWSKWMWNLNAMHYRRVRCTQIQGAWISTAFLGLNHNCFGNDELHVFETMIFPDNDIKDDVVFGRCGTWRHALNMHWRAVAIYKSILKEEFFENTH